MRIALVRPDRALGGYDPQIQEPLGIEMLAALLRAHGFHAELFDSIIHELNEEEISGALDAGGFSLVGFTLMSHCDLSSTLEIIQLMRSEPRPFIAAGGSFATTEPETVLRAFPPGAVCIIGEGERSLLALAGLLSERRAPFDIPSTAIRLENGQIEYMDRDRSPVDLGELPFADRSLCQPLLIEGSALNLQGSRGCCGRCRYCCMSSGGGRGWRGRPGEHIAREIESLYAELGARFFSFVDDDFLGPDPRSRAEDLCGEILGRGLRIAFGIQARPRSLNADILAQLREAGLCYVFTGIESDDPKALKAWNRPDDSGLIAGLSKAAAEMDIKIQAGGIPFHKAASLQSIKRFAGKLEACGMLNYRTATNRLALLPGSPMYEEYAASHGILGNSGSILEEFDDPRAELLYDALKAALSPLYPVWLHAACIAPRVAAQRRLGDCSIAFAGQFDKIRAELDAEVGIALFRIIDELEIGGDAKELTGFLGRRAAVAAEESLNSLCKLKLVRSPASILSEMRRAEKRLAL